MREEHRWRRRLGRSGKLLLVFLLMTALLTWPTNYLVAAVSAWRAPTYVVLDAKLFEPVHSQGYFDIDRTGKSIVQEFRAFSVQIFHVMGGSTAHWTIDDDDLPLAQWQGKHRKIATRIERVSRPAAGSSNLDPIYIAPIVVRGWPVTSMASGWRNGKWHRNDTLTVLGTTVEVPNLMIYPAAIFNTAFYVGSVWFVFATIRWIKRKAARGRGRCASCGYDLAGLGECPVCPECGAGCHACCFEQA
jgi:hypothetical protein